MGDQDTVLLAGRGGHDRGGKPSVRRADQHAWQRRRRARHLLPDDVAAGSPLRDRAARHAAALGAGRRGRRRVRRGNRQAGGLALGRAGRRAAVHRAAGSDQVRTGDQVLRDGDGDGRRRQLPADPSAQCGLAAAAPLADRLRGQPGCPWPPEHLRAAADPRARDHGRAAPTPPWRRSGHTHACRPMAGGRGGWHRDLQSGAHPRLGAARPGSLDRE